MTKRTSKKTRPSKRKSTPKKKAKISEKTSPQFDLVFSIERFLTDMECLRELFREVVPILHKKDGIRAEKLKAFTEEIKKLPKDGDKKNLVLLHNLMTEFMETLAKHNRANAIFKRNSVVSVISRFEEFLGTALAISYKQNPARFSDSDKMISYQEILSLSDTASPLNLIIAKEIDDVLRKGPDEQLKHIDRDFKLGLGEHFKERPIFLEICERRNLFAHTGGQISKQYIKVCTEGGYKFSTPPKLGNILEVDEKYFDQAYIVFSSLGLRIGQTLLRRLFPTNLESADTSLNKIGFDLLVREDYKLAECVFDFALSLYPKHLSSDSWGKIFLINRCICLYHQDRKEEMRKALAGVDWSSADSKFLLAVQILTDQFEKAAQMMKTFSSTFPIEEHEYLRWPLFRAFRNTSSFKDAYKHLYGKDVSLNSALLAEIDGTRQA